MILSKNHDSIDFIIQKSERLKIFEGIIEEYVPLTAVSGN